MATRVAMNVCHDGCTVTIDAFFHPRLAQRNSPRKLQRPAPPCIIWSGRTSTTFSTYVSLQHSARMPSTWWETIGKEPWCTPGGGGMVGNDRDGQAVRHPRDMAGSCRHHRPRGIGCCADFCQPINGSLAIRGFHLSASTTARGIGVGGLVGFLSGIIFL